MLLVNARAGASTIHGGGANAQEFIPAGTRIWEFRQGFDIALTADEEEITFDYGELGGTDHLGWHRWRTQSDV